MIKLLSHGVQTAFSALTLSVGRQEEHPACKNLSDEMLQMAWLSVRSEVQMITFRVSRRWRQMYSGHGHLCLSVCPSPHSRTTTWTRM